MDSADSVAWILLHSCCLDSNVFLDSAGAVIINEHLAGVLRAPEAAMVSTLQ